MGMSDSMALDESILVDIPEHGIAYKKVSGKTYVYYVTATYRNKKGQPTCDHSIQVEGAFGVLKEDYAFRRFLTRGKSKTETQFLLLSFAFNIQKLCNRLNSGRFHMPLFEKMIA